MVGFELANLAGTAALGAYMTVKANQQEHQRTMDELRLVAEEKRAEMWDRARKVDANPWVSFMRWMVVAAFISVHVFAIVAPAFLDVTVTFFFYEASSGFFPWQVAQDELHSFTVGTGRNPILITPLNYSVLMSVTGFLFGHVTAKR